MSEKLDPDTTPPNKEQRLAKATQALALGNIEDAAAICDGLLKNNGTDAEALHLRAEIYSQQGDAKRSLAIAALAAKHAPRNAAYHHHLGLALYSANLLDEALVSFERALALEPTLASAWSNKAFVYLDQKRFFESKTAFEHALEMQPSNINAIVNLAMVWGQLGRTKEAGRLLTKAEALDPTATGVKRARLQLMNYDVSVTGLDVLLQAKSLWSPAGKLKAWSPRKHSPEAGSAEKQKLKIGYISADFYGHPVGRLILPVLECHDRTKFSIALYSDHRNEDEVTRSIRGTSDSWSVIAGRSDDEVLSLIVHDDIDILVDLAGHTHNNRLRIFLNKPAPIQMSWLGYCGSTGLKEMDYALVDQHVVKPGEEALYTETPLILPHSLLSYTGSSFADPVQTSPCMESNQITFGSFNNPSKINEQVIRLWSNILDAVPNSKLIVKYHSLSDQLAIETVIRQFEENGLDATRLIVLGKSPDDIHVAAYNRVDIALDPFPYNGTMTTLDALWMGVPVVSLEGERWISRMTAGILKTVGLDELVAQSESEYVNLAVGLASNQDRLCDLRRTMRDRVTSSPLGDTEGFTKSLESLYRNAWRDWCISANQAK